MNSCKHCQGTGFVFHNIEGETISQNEFNKLKAEGEYAGDEYCFECSELVEEFSNYDPDEYHDSRH